jgi:replicative DNA helicase
MEHQLTDPSTINLPISPDAEAAILACIIEEPKRFAPKAWEAQIGSEFFSVPAHASLFKILMDRIRSQRPVDPSSIKEDIRKLKPDGLAISDLAAVLNHEKSTEGWSGYMSSLRDTHARRLILTAATESAGKDGREVLDAMRKASESASAALEGLSAVSDSKKAVGLFMDAFKERHANGMTPGISTGIHAIDEHTGGMRKGELWVIGAKTSGGKSILMIQIAAAAVENGKKVAIFTLELATEEIVGRMLSCMARIPISQIMNPKTITSINMPKVIQQSNQLQDTGLMVCDSADMTIDTISGHCIRIQETTGLELVVIDYVQMVASPRIKGQSREQEVASISRACKQLAKRLKCPVLTATQLNEAGQSRESRAIEHDADNLFVIDHKTEGDRASVTVQAWKCRNGVRGTIFPVVMDGLHQRFSFS